MNQNNKWDELNLWDSERLVRATEDLQDVLQLLVSNMKTGVGLFEVKADEINVLYLNQAFYERLGMSKTNYPDIPDSIQKCVKASPVM